ncbi:MAG: SDR family oxidoreductase [Gemmatimonadaceae bacterium]
MTSGIEGKVVAITGASSGIGKATAILLAERGASVVLAARRLIELNAVAEQITALGGVSLCVATDVSRRADVVALVDATIARFGRLDVLVSNAGVSRIGPFDDVNVDDWEAMIDINLKGFLYGIAAALPVFRRQGTGHFVTVISTAGLRIVPNQGVYAATKNAVRTICEGLRQEAGATLRVTGISPGFVKTNLADSITNPALKSQIMERMEEMAIPPEAIARAIAFAIEQPNDVDVGDIVVRPTAQS